MDTGSQPDLNDHRSSGQAEADLSQELPDGFLLPETLGRHAELLIDECSA